MATINEQILAKLQAEMLSASTAGTVIHDDVSITYRTLTELLQAIKYYDGLVSNDAGTGAGRIRAVNRGRGIYSS